MKHSTNIVNIEINAMIFIYQLTKGATYLSHNSARDVFCEGAFICIPTGIQQKCFL